MEALWTELRNLRERQDEDFESVMQAFVVQRDVVGSVEDSVKALSKAVETLSKSVEALAFTVKELKEQQTQHEKAFASYRESTGLVLNTMESLIRGTQQSMDQRFAAMEKRIEALEHHSPPAA